MRKFLAAFALAFLFAVPAYGQAFLPGVNVQDTNPQPVKQMCWSGSAYVSCSSASGSNVVQRGAGSINTGQVSAGTSSTLIVAARTGRARVTLTVGAANSCAFGNSGVTLTTGFPTQPVAGASIPILTSAAIYGVCSAATTIGFIEEF